MLNRIRIAIRIAMYTIIWNVAYSFIKLKQNTREIFIERLIKNIASATKSIKFLILYSKLT